MDSNVRNYIAKEGEIYVDDFMTDDEEEENGGRKMDESEFIALKNKFNLVINKDKFILNRSGCINDYYTIGKLIGKGVNGEVYHADSKTIKVSRAIKKISKDKIKDINRFLFEVQTLKTLDHPNVVKLFEIYENHNSVFLVQELCTGGELLDHIIKANGMNETRATFILKQIFQAIKYCNKNKISHRDLKPENFMFASENEGAVLKLIDFGLARTYYKEEVLALNQIIRMRTRAGTTFFMAPEVILNNYTQACDMWSAGVILYIILSGYPPFSGTTDEEILENILRGEYDFDDKIWDSISPEAKDLIEKLLTSEDERLTPKDALIHPWIHNYSRLESEVILSHTHTERLRNFQKSKKLKKAALTYLASRVSDEDILTEI
jgi:calcium-dependent protein kinase